MGSGASKGVRDPNRSRAGSANSERKHGNARGRAISGEKHEHTEKNHVSAPNAKKNAADHQEGGRKHLSQPRDTNTLENQSDKKTLNQSSQQGQSVPIGSHNYKKDQSNQKLAHPVLGRHKSKSILSDLSQQIHASPLKEQLYL